MVFRDTKNEDDEAWKQNVLCCYTIMLNLLALGLYVSMFFLFLGRADVEDKDCGGNLAFMIIGLVSFIVVTFLRLRPQSSIFTAALVNCWLAWIAWSALASSPDTKCNNTAGQGWTTFVQILFHLAFTFGTMFGLSIQTADDSTESSSSNDQEAAEQSSVGKLMAAKTADNKKTADELELSDVKAEGGSESKASLKEEIKQEIKAEMQGEATDEEEDYIFEVTTGTVLFQLVLVIVACHYGMVMTNWGDPVVNNDKSNFFANNELAFGIKTAMFAISLFIYLLSQLMVLCCRDRFVNDE